MDYERTMPPALQRNEAHQRERSGKRRERSDVERGNRLRRRRAPRPPEYRIAPVVQLNCSVVTKVVLPERAVAGIGGDGNRDRRARRQAAAETQNMKRRIDADEAVRRWRPSRR